MKYLGLVLLILILFSCNGNQESTASSTCKESLMINHKTYCLDSISKADFVSANYAFPTKADTIGMDTSKIVVSPAGIRIKAQQKEVILKNVLTENETYKVFHYVKTLAHVGLVHVQATCYEWTEDYLINLKTGEQTLIWGQPFLSPSHHLLFCGASEFNSDRDLVGFQVYKIENGAVKKIVEKETSKWGPSQIKWESDNAILMKRKHAEENNRERFDFVRLHLN